VQWPVLQCLLLITRSGPFSRNSQDETINIKMAVDAIYHMTITRLQATTYSSCYLFSRLGKLDKLDGDNALLTQTLFENWRSAMQDMWHNAGQQAQQQRRQGDLDNGAKNGIG
jgi:hypothetical protein